MGNPNRDPHGRPSVVVEPRQPSAGLSRRLEVRGEIAEGGIARIKLAIDRSLAREMALKVLQPRYRGDEKAVARLVEEAQIMAQLEHPGIVPVHELGVDEGGEVFFTMKLVRGRTLHEILDSVDYRNRTEDELFDHLQIFLRACDAVEFAHSRGVIHRDLTPDNIMVGEYGEVYVMDWGIARLQQRRPSTLDQAMPGASAARYEVGDEDGMIFGTPGFMAPEQARGDLNAVDERTDVFSMGAILYHLLTQAPPYFGRDSEEMVINTLTREIVPPEDRVDLPLHPELCRIAMKALRRDPQGRYRGVGEMKRDLERFLRSGWRLPRRTYRAGEVIIREGTPGDEAYLVARGRCLAYKTVDGVELRLRELVEGDVLGETAVLTGSAHTAGVRAVEDVTVLVVGRDSLGREMGTGYLTGRFLKALAERFRERDDEATRAALDADRFELATSILKYLVFSGTSPDPHHREAKWSSLAEVLSSYFRRTPQEIAAMVEDLGFFRVDAARDTVVLQRAG